jgi:hypothetical protein
LNWGFLYIFLCCFFAIYTYIYCVEFRLIKNYKANGRR